MNTPQYKKGQTIRVDDLPQWTYQQISPGVKPGLHIVTDPDDNPHIVNFLQITPDVPEPQPEKTSGDLAFIFGHAKHYRAGSGHFDQGAKAAYTWIANKLEPLMPTIVAALTRDNGESAYQVYVTAERKPTKEDSNCGGYVEAGKYGGTQWMLARWDDPSFSSNGYGRYDIWRAVDKPPATPAVELAEEEKELAAFRKWADSIGWMSNHPESDVRRTWLAALEWKESQSK